MPSGINIKILAAIAFFSFLAPLHAWAGNEDISLGSKWGLLKTPKQQGHFNPETDSLENLQALSYLQGYNTPPQFKNVILYDKAKAFNGYNLVLSADAPRALLMDMNANTIHQWYYPAASLNIGHPALGDYWVMAHIFDNGDLLAMIPLAGLLKLDKDSHLIWFKKIICHHDFTFDGQGDIYTFMSKDSKLENAPGRRIDSIVVLSPEGKFKKEISIYQLFKKYPDQVYFNRINQGYYGHSKYVYPQDIFHSNSIQILDGRWASKIPAFKKGNLLVNIRNLGVIICVDPVKEEIVWMADQLAWSVGQHYAKLLDNGHILLFDNLYKPDRLSRVVEFDPANNEIVWVYADRLFSFFDGLCYRLPNGNTLIVESTNGHAFEVTPDKKIVWDYYNPHQVVSRVVSKPQLLIAMLYQVQRIAADDPTLRWLNRYRLPLGRRY